MVYVRNYVKHSYGQGATGVSASGRLWTGTAPRPILLRRGGSR